MTGVLQELLNEGAKAIAAHDFEEAVGIYSEACQVANLETGKDDPDLMFLYAKALFENGRVLNDVLGDVEKKEGGNKEVEEQEEDGGDEKKKSQNGAFQFNDDLAEEEEEEDEYADNDYEENGEDMGQEEEEEENAEEKNELEDSKNGEAEEGEEGKDGANGEEEQSDFEIAWEILELARILYQERLDDAKESNIAKPYTKHKEGHEKYVDTIVRLADVYMLMGDISLETENFPQSLEDFDKGIELIEAAYGCKSGRFREGKFKLSLAHEFVGDEENMDASIKCMEDVLKNLKSNLPIDIDLVEDVEMRVKELKETVKERAEEKEKIVGMFCGVVKEVKRDATNDLTGLVKRKKK